MEKKSFLEDSQFGSVSYFKVDLIECAIVLMPIHWCVAFLSSFVCFPFPGVLSPSPFYVWIIISVLAL